MRLPQTPENDRIYCLIRDAVAFDSDTGEPVDEDALGAECAKFGWAVHQFMRYPAPE